MFKRKPTPESIADKLGRALLPSGADYLASYMQAVCPDEKERKRMMFSLILYPVTASYGMLVTTTDPRLRELLIQAHEVHLSRILDQDQLVNLGDYIVWGIERDAICRELRERHCQLILPSSFDSHQMRYGMLLRAVADIRKNMYLTDIDLGMSRATDQQHGLINAFTALATTFTRGILKIDPTSQSFTEDQAQRLQTSIAYASSLQGHGFFQMADILKELRQ